MVQAVVCSAFTKILKDVAVGDRITSIVFSNYLHKLSFSLSLKVCEIGQSMAISVELSCRESLIKFVETSLNSKVVSQYSSPLEMLIDSVSSHC